MIAGIIVGAAIIAILLRTPLMRIPPPEEFMPTMARQELQSFHSSYRYFKNGHGKEPDSIQELLADGKYLTRVVEPHRTKILQNLKYPVTEDFVSDVAGPVLATYHVAGFGDFFLITNGIVVERRVRDYNESSFWRAQEAEDELIKRQLPAEITGGKKP